MTEMEVTANSYPLSRLIDDPFRNINRIIAVT